MIGGVNHLDFCFHFTEIMRERDYRLLRACGLHAEPNCIGVGEGGVTRVQKIDSLSKANVSSNTVPLRLPVDQA